MKNVLIYKQFQNIYWLFFKSCKENFEKKTRFAWIIVSFPFTKLRRDSWKPNLCCKWPNYDMCLQISLSTTVDVVCEWVSRHGFLNLIFLAFPHDHAVIIHPLDGFLDIDAVTTRVLPPWSIPIRATSGGAWACYMADADMAVIRALERRV